MSKSVSARSRRIVLWRHGRTEWNAQQRFQGQTDIPLDEVGLEQAVRAAEQLALLHPDLIISSDLKRARVTAEQLAIRSGLPVTENADLRETFAGEWEGLDRPTLLERHSEDLARWSAMSDVRPGGGETRIEVADRMVRAIGVALTDVRPGGTLVVVTHGGAARAAIGALLELPTDSWACLGVLSNCAWSVLTENGTEYGPAWRLQEYNAGSLPAPALADDR